MDDILWPRRLEVGVILVTVFEVFDGLLQQLEHSLVLTEIRIDLIDLRF